MIPVKIFLHLKSHQGVYLLQNLLGLQRYFQNWKYRIQCTSKIGFIEYGVDFPGYKIQICIEITASESIIKNRAMAKNSLAIMTILKTDNSQVTFFTDCLGMKL